jgi:hypothetical protein
VSYKKLRQEIEALQAQLTPTFIEDWASPGFVDKELSKGLLLLVK